MSIPKRIKSLVVAGLLGLLLTIGVAGTTVSAAPKKQLPVVCVYFSQEDTISTWGFDPGSGGYWDCDFQKSAPTADHKSRGQG